MINAMHMLDGLDEPKAALRMLIELSSSIQGMNVTWLYRVMREKYSVGRPAVDSSVKALMEAGLVEEYESNGARSRLKVIILTQLGDEIVLRLRDIETIMEGAKKQS